MSDYRIRISVRNARLLHAIKKAGHRPGPQFADLVGIDYGAVLLPYLNLTRSPLNRGGLIRECAWALCDYLGASLDQLWSDEQLTPLQSNSAQKDFSYEQVLSLYTPTGHGDLDPQSLTAKSQAARLLLASLDELTPREASVIRYRFGIGFSEMTLNEVGDRLGQSKERVRQIESKALRKLRHPKRNLAALTNAFDMVVPAHGQGSIAPIEESHD